MEWYSKALRRFFLFWQGGGTILVLPAPYRPSSGFSTHSEVIWWFHFQCHFHVCLFRFCFLYVVAVFVFDLGTRFFQCTSRSSRGVMAKCSWAIRRREVFPGGKWYGKAPRFESREKSGKRSWECEKAYSVDFGLFLSILFSGDSGQLPNDRAAWVTTQSPGEGESQNPKC